MSHVTHMKTHLNSRKPAEKDRESKWGSEGENEGEREWGSERESEEGWASDCVRVCVREKERVCVCVWESTLTAASDPTLRDSCDIPRTPGNIRSAPPHTNLLVNFFKSQSSQKSNFIGISYSASSTGWQRPIGCLKLQVSFRKRATNYRDLLRKMFYKDEASYASCTVHLVASWLLRISTWRAAPRRKMAARLEPPTDPLLWETVFLAPVSKFVDEWKRVAARVPADPLLWGNSFSCPYTFVKMWMSHVAYECVVLRICMGHVTYRCGQHFSLPL